MAKTGKAVIKLDVFLGFNIPHFLVDVFLIHHSQFMKKCIAYFRSPAKTCVWVLLSNLKHPHWFDPSYKPLL